MNDDAELLRRFVEEQSEAAFTELVHRRLGLVYAAALRRVGGDVHLAEDVAQRVFTALARKARTVRHHTTVVGWLLVSTAHAAAETVRAEQRRKHREMRAMNESCTEPALPEDARLLPAVEQALLELRTEDRDAVALRYFEQLSFAEVGRNLRTSEEGARKRVDRALEKLRILLARRGVTSSATAIGVALVALTTASVPSRVAAAIASEALAQSAAGTTAATLAAPLTALPLVAVLIGGIWLAHGQHAENGALRAELASLRLSGADMAMVEAETRRLEERGREINGLRLSAAVPVAATTSLPVVAPPPATRRVSAHVRITPENTIEWEGTPITLDDFLQHLSDVASDPVAANGRINVRAPGTPFSVLSYIIEEAAKAHVNHLSVESDARPQPNQGTATWF